jgi:flagellar basal body rod protein FlgG
MEKLAMSRRGDFTVSADGTLRDGTGTQPLSTDLTTNNYSSS